MINTIQNFSIPTSLQAYQGTQMELTLQNSHGKKTNCTFSPTLTFLKEEH